MAKRGRPSAYDADLGARVCEAIATGSGVEAALASCPEFPCRDVFYRWLSESSDLRDKYARARDCRADARFEGIDAVVQDMRAGTIDAAQARVQIDTIKWQCGKESAKRYGERLELAGEVTTTTKSWAEVLAEKQAERAKGKE